MEYLMRLTGIRADFLVEGTPELSHERRGRRGRRGLSSRGVCVRKQRKREHSLPGGWMVSRLMMLGGKIQAKGALHAEAGTTAGAD